MLKIVSIAIMLSLLVLGTVFSTIPVQSESEPLTLNIKLVKIIENNTLVLSISVVIVNNLDQIYMLKKISDPVVNVSGDDKQIVSLRLHAPDELVIHPGENVISSITITINTTGLKRVSIYASSGEYSITNSKTGEQYNLSETRRFDILLSGARMNTQSNHGVNGVIFLPGFNTLNSATSNNSSRPAGSFENYTLIRWGKNESFSTVKLPFNPSDSLRALALISILAVVILLAYVRSLLDKLLFKD